MSGMPDMTPTYTSKFNFNMLEKIKFPVNTNT